jgi:hypothetical protein
MALRGHFVLSWSTLLAGSNQPTITLLAGKLSHHGQLSSASLITTLLSCFQWGADSSHMLKHALARLTAYGSYGFFAFCSLSLGTYPPPLVSQCLPLP